MMETHLKALLLGGATALALTGCTTMNQENLAEASRDAEPAVVAMADAEPD